MEVLDFDQRIGATFQHMQAWGDSTEAMVFDIWSIILDMEDWVEDYMKGLGDIALIEFNEKDNHSF
jgi:hypothetical protein